jgi:hypothetical protein
VFISSPADSNHLTLAFLLIECVLV